MKSNVEIANLLRQIAALLDAEGIEENVTFKVRAYLKAAKVIEELPRGVSALRNEKELMELPGIGKAIAEKIIEYLQTGKITALEKLRRAQGGVSPELMQVENLGAKRAKQIQTELGITTIKELVAAARAGKLRGLPRMSELMEQKILESALRSGERSKRFPRGDVANEVEKLLKAIRNVPGVERTEAAGSYRRKKETVGDIDILVVTRSPKKVSEAVAVLSFIRNVVAQGDKKLSFDLQGGIRVDVRFVQAAQWGSALLYFTGDKDHNIAMRKVAIRKGWKLSEYGLFDRTGKVIASKEERDVYDALGLRYWEPWQRRGIL
jgi:DNA polymerase (family X)